MMGAIAASDTLLEALITGLGRAASYSRNAMAATAAILWPDEARQWQPLVPLLRQLHPTLLTLGEYFPEQRTRQLAQ